MSESTTATATLQGPVLRLRVADFVLEELNDLPPYVTDIGRVYYLMRLLDKNSVCIGSEAYRFWSEKLGEYLKLTNPERESAWPEGIGRSDLLSLVTSVRALIMREIEPAPAGATA